MASFEKKEEHPSYIQVSFSRRHGNFHKRLYGSSIGHTEVVALEIHESQKCRDLNRTWYFPRKKILELEMSQNQFAELITTLNMGSGVPATLIWSKEAGMIEQCDDENIRELFEDEFKEIIDDTLMNARNAVKAIRVALEKKAIRKSDVRECLERLQVVERELTSTFPFIYEQFNEQMDKSVSEAKNEVDAFVEGKLRSAGLEHLAEETQVRLAAVDAEVIEDKSEDEE